MYEWFLYSLMVIIIFSTISRLLLWYQRRSVSASEVLAFIIGLLITVPAFYIIPMGGFADFTFFAAISFSIGSAFIFHLIPISKTETYNLTNKWLLFALPVIFIFMFMQALDSMFWH